jgi:hypothetical protein
MAWLTELPTGIFVNVQRYYETRTSPTNPDKNQIRDKSTGTIEYRGVDLNTAITAIQGFPTQGSQGQASRSFQAIGGGGYTVTEIFDVVKSDWVDELDYEFPE